MSNILRSKELIDEYKAHRDTGIMNSECVLCNATAIESFTSWKVIKNNFPYDLIAETHNMLVPLRHIKEGGLNEVELKELAMIKDGYVQDYDYIIEATNRTKSIPEHFHLHLIIGKKD